MRGLGGFLKDSVDSALTVERLQGTVYQLGENMGRTREEIDGLVGSIREENKSLREALEISQAIVIADLEQADAIQLLTIARDVGAAMGKSSAEVNRAIVASIQKLNVAQLESVGIIVSERVAYQEMAAQLGIASSQLTVAQKRQAIWNQVQKEGTKFTGQYNAAMNTGAKVMNSARDAFEDVRTVVGKLVSDAIQPLAKRVLEVIRSFREFVFTADGKLQPQIQAIADKIFYTLVPAIIVLINGFVAFGKMAGEILFNFDRELEGTTEKTYEEVKRQQMAWRAIQATVQGTIGYLIAIFKLIANLVVSAVAAAAGAIANMWNQLVNGIQFGTNMAIDASMDS